MITDKEIQKIFNWADKNNIKNRGVEKERLGDKVINWRKGIPRNKKNLLEMEYLELGFWRYKKLTSIPNELFKLPKLKGLSILLNHLAIMDKENLQKITFLKVDADDSNKNNFISFINVLNTLTHLEYLNIQGGKVEEIPKNIFNLNDLKYLELFGWYKIKELPSAIKELNNLEVLSLKGCSIKNVAIEIGTLQKLKYLDLYNLDIQELPKEIGNLTQLKELDYRYTNIKKLPDEISNLINLEKLNGEAYIRIKNEEKEVNNKQINTAPKHLFSSLEKGSIENFKIKTLLLKGVPGTGKSRAIENIINNKLQLKDHKQNILRINIHSASSNADLMQGIGISSTDGKIEYKEKQGLILNFIEKATFNPHQPFVLVLEEIQENSLNELIGDLIYLIEDDKRAKGYEADDEVYGYQELVEKVIADKPETAYVEIPYLVNSSTEYRKMIMPDNLYIFCTSNYRDDKKVIEDNLLRRFEVLEIYPKYKEDIGESFINQDVSDFLKRLNNSILEVLNDEIHPDRFLIGHSNWLNVDSEEAFFRAFLKVVVEFKDIKEVEFSDFKSIINDTSTLPEWIGTLQHNSYKELIEYIQFKSGYDFLD